MAKSAKKLAEVQGLLRLIKAVPEATNGAHGGYNARWCGADGTCERCDARQKLADYLLSRRGLHVDVDLFAEAIEALDKLGEARAVAGASGEPLLPTFEPGVDAALGPLAVLSDRVFKKE